MARSRSSSSRATSDYWKPVFYLLEAQGLDPWLVNAKDVKHLPGRPKTDRLDAVWLAKVAERQVQYRSRRIAGRGAQASTRCRSSRGTPAAGAGRGGLSPLGLDQVQRAADRVEHVGRRVDVAALLVSGSCRDAGIAHRVGEGVLTTPGHSPMIRRRGISGRNMDSQAGRGSWPGRQQAPRPGPPPPPAGRKRDGRANPVPWSPRRGGPRRRPRSPARRRPGPPRRPPPRARSARRRRSHVLCRSGAGP